MGISNLYVNVNISYFNVINKYIIGLKIGRIYTILDDKFDTEEEAKKYVIENIY